jgi:hypothetical protein
MQITCCWAKTAVSARRNNLIMDVQTKGSRRTLSGTSTVSGRDIQVLTRASSAEQDAAAETPRKHSLCGDCWKAIQLFRFAVSPQSPYYLWKLFITEFFEFIFQILQLQVSFL